ncbi:MAG TPA: NADH:ubiquinone reductase (Na(+)-transporting) subunit C [Myxococcota bacterium]|nr:NADH:ubiquinone reductase (Na(+)-transporting) subunit C [Myxococcota bacterium]
MAEPGPGRTLLVALAVCGVCSLVVTGSVVLLRPFQVENQQRERERRVRALVDGLPGVSDLVEAAGEARIELRVVELATGAYATSRDASALLEKSDGAEGEVPLPPERDPAGIGYVPTHVVVYELRRGDRVDTAILPIHGQGYLSMMRGYLAVAGDGETVRGIAFTEHHETPGLGSEVESPEWQARWQGRRLYGSDGEVRIRVVKTLPAAGSPDAPYVVQGISGATLTSAGVSELVRFWVGPDGFGPYLERLRAAAGSEGEGDPS